MSDRDVSRVLADAVIEAVLDTPGVAFLRPGLADLLRTSALLRRGLPSTPAGSAGVQVRRPKDTQGWSVEVFVVLHRGRRALDVTREVRAATAKAFERVTGEQTAPGIAVTVTGLV
ncbi:MULTISPECIES: Asp23/Gls24 family envelope stress response protein [unclassified Streptomyces]|uniref:Asp23/Gls24 family envelope stress response protein n=1 Tax=unclassified Streptomyces TaxID=2593676 RepID=UPI0034108216